jgi:2-haloalkanoic acid dehalogenase type II
MADDSWLGGIRAVTFDCYGTLVDWEAGIAAYVGPHLERAARGGVGVSTKDWIARWEPIQFALLTPYRPYHEVLVESFQQTMRAFELECFADGGPGLVRSVGEWPPFADTVPSLRRMARRRRLAIVSNIDRALLADTLGRLLVPLSAIVTAEDAGAYKPDAAPFRLALSRLGLPPSAILHAAFGWRYDLAPARAVGMRTCFVNRGGGAAPPGVEADLEVPSLAALAERLEAASAT